MCKKEKYEKHRNVLVFFLNLRNARYSYFSGTVLRNPKHFPHLFCLNKIREQVCKRTAEDGKSYQHYARYSDSCGITAFTVFFFISHFVNLSLVRLFLFKH